MCGMSNAEIIQGARTVNIDLAWHWDMELYIFHCATFFLFSVYFFFFLFFYPNMKFCMFIAQIEFLYEMGFSFNGTIWWKLPIGGVQFFNTLYVRNVLWDRDIIRIIMTNGYIVQLFISVEDGRALFIRWFHICAYVVIIIAGLCAIKFPWHRRIGRNCLI